ncbi:MAG: FAD:protein FMN transferase [Tannerellaceae bacterium]|jgi:thiamine biosynthesis lipoprotein|nr:FAD:protein FMN transferase [Tannerellaceae bacterium]
MYRHLFPIAAAILLSACRNTVAPYHEENGSVFNTLYHIKYQSPQPLSSQIDSTFQALNNSFNPFLPTSCIARLNRNETSYTDEHLRRIITRALEISRLSDGVFDITAAPLINLWGFGYQRHDTVTPQAIDSILRFVGYQKIRLLPDGRLQKDDPRIQINCSAIAKGYAADVIADVLRRYGAENYMVEIGGEIVLCGYNAQGQPWRIGIRQPHENPAGEGLQDILSLTEPCGIATSGDYLNYYRQDGRTYAHTIDPRTGYPSRQNILSATVIAEDAMTADALATTFNALGLDRAIPLADSLASPACPAPIRYHFIYADSLAAPDSPLQTRSSPSLLH